MTPPGVFSPATCLYLLETLSEKLVNILYDWVKHLDTRKTTTRGETTISAKREFLRTLLINTNVDELQNDISLEDKVLQSVLYNTTKPVLKDTSTNTSEQPSPSTPNPPHPFSTSDISVNARIEDIVGNTSFTRMGKREVRYYGQTPFREFIYFDKISAKVLHNAVKVLGDPSFSAQYSREYTAIALNPILFGTAGTGPNEFYGPSSLDIDKEGRLFVCDSTNCRVCVYSNHDHPKPLFSFGRKGKAHGELNRPSSISVDYAGHVYVADSFNDQVSVFSTVGKWQFSVGGTGRLNKPRGVSATKNGSVFVVSDTGNQRIMVYSGDGTCKGAFGKLGIKKGQFVRPQGIYITNDKTVYVSDTFNFRVDVFDIEGRLMRTIGEQGSEEGKFKHPRSVCVDNNGNILVTDSSKHSLQIFDKHGSFIKEYGGFGSGKHQFDSPDDVVCDDVCRIYVADRKNNRVHIL